jgi:hypothetical protein
MTDGDENSSLSRPQRRWLKRIYNGRTRPIAVHGTSFITYKQAAAYLQSLTPEVHDEVVGAMRDFVRDEGQ